MQSRARAFFLQIFKIMFSIESDLFLNRDKSFLPNLYSNHYALGRLKIF